MGLIIKRLFWQEPRGTLTTTLHHGSGLAISRNLHDLENDRLFIKHRYCIDSRFLSLSCHLSVCLLEVLSRKILGPTALQHRRCLRRSLPQLLWASCYGLDPPPSPRRYCRAWPSTRRPPLRNAVTLLWLWGQPGDDFEPEQKGTPENVLDLLDSWAVP